MKQPKRQKSENFKTVNFQLDEDQQLWNAIKLGDSIALKELFDKYYADLYFYGSKLENTHNNAADTIQDLFANIWEKRKSNKEVKYVKAYLFTSLRNNILKNAPKDLLNECYSDEGLTSNLNFDISPEEIYLDQESQIENQRIIKELLAKLCPNQKEIIYLKFYGNYSNLEISEILSIKQQSVANLLARTIKTLRKHQKQNNINLVNMLISGLM